eukprot:TRINITY_DN18631_c0_g1_i2.p1 TRINITY_DN18631_c0_g1~~TRINITY_DN18631_c0_g1_i2.p1  ORF type:complete len:415 (-),score=21.14 TRINITY_DN18631_c0_g1_i2:65-1276(-)
MVFTLCAALPFKDSHDYINLPGGCKIKLALIQSSNRRSFYHSKRTRKFQHRILAELSDKEKENVTSLKDNQDSNSNNKVSSTQDIVQELLKLMNEREDKLRDFYKQQYQDAQKQYENQLQIVQMQIQHLFVDLEHVNEKILELEKQCNRDNVSNNHVVKDLVQKVKNLQSTQQKQQQSNNNNQKLTQQVGQLINEVKNIVPYMFNGKGGGSSETIQLKTLSDQINSFKSQLQQQQSQISKLQKQMQSLGSQQSKYNINKLMKVELKNVECDYYSSSKQQYKLTFDVKSKNYGVLVFHIPYDKFGEYLFDYHRNTYSMYQTHRDNSYRNLRWAMVLVKNTPQEVIMYESGINENSCELEICFNNSIIYYFCGKIAHIIHLVQYSDAPIYITKEVAGKYCKEQRK